MDEIEKSSKSQLAREIEIALPVELDRQAQLALVRAYIKDNFVSAGMCADFSIHDKGDGNPHAHIMLTMRPLEQSGKWGEVPQGISNRPAGPTNPRRQGRLQKPPRGRNRLE